MFVSFRARRNTLVIYAVVWVLMAENEGTPYDTWCHKTFFRDALECLKYKKVFFSWLFHVGEFYPFEKEEICVCTLGGGVCNDQLASGTLFVLIYNNNPPHTHTHTPHSQATCYKNPSTTQRLWSWKKNYVDHKIYSPCICTYELYFNWV